MKQQEIGSQAAERTKLEASAKPPVLGPAILPGGGRSAQARPGVSTPVSSGAPPVPARPALEAEINGELIEPYGGAALQYTQKDAPAMPDGGKDPHEGSN